MTPAALGGGMAPTFRFRYTAIRARDLDRSIAFYGDVLGLPFEGRDAFPANKGEAAYFRGEGMAHPLEVNWYAEDSPVAGPYREGEELDHLAFEVADLEEALAYLDQEGHPTVLGPIESQAAVWAYVTDPDGIYVELFQRKGE